jgi:hypothetical protein
MKQRIAAMLVLGMTLFIGACAGLLGQRSVEVPLAQLQEQLANRFPFNSRYLEIFDIHLTNPQLSLQPETNRVVTTVSASILPTFLKQPWSGTFTLSGRLAVDPERRALVLAEPRMENVNLAGLDNRYAQQAVRIGSLLAEEVLSNIPLYTFTEDKFRYAGTNFVPTEIATRNNGLVVTFEPVK